MKSLILNNWRMTMCTAIREAKSLSKVMKVIDPVGSYHHRIFLNFCLKEFKKGRIRAEELKFETLEYKKLYLN